MTPFIIFCRAVGIYALLTVPALTFPEMYVISLVLALTFGWFAWLAFTALYFVIGNLVFGFVARLAAIFAAIVIAVAFAYSLLGAIVIKEDIWHGACIIFPFAAVIAGWISACISRESIRCGCYAPEGN
jgi:Na+/alanine symporter